MRFELLVADNNNDVCKWTGQKHFVDPGEKTIAVAFAQKIYLGATRSNRF
jgi:hypothetical protein